MKIFYKHSFVLLLGLIFLVASPVRAQILIKDIRPGLGSSAPEQLININGTHGKELWKSDGTAQGTVLVKDIISGADESKVKNLTDVNGTLFFSAKMPVASFGIQPNQLFKSDGTAAGTVELLDGQGNKAESKDPENLTNVGGTLYYTNTLALGGNSYTGLFKSDGTNSPGTVRINYYDSNPPNFPKLSQLTNLNGTLYYIYGGGLYKSNGTLATTALVKTISPGPADNTKIKDLTNVNGTLFFSADDGSSGGVRRLWKSDGTAAGTVKLNDGITNPAEGPNPTNLTNVNGTLYYTSLIVKGGSSYWGLFKSDGTDSPGTGFFGTFVRSANESPLSNNIPYGSTANQAASPSSFININGTLYFVFANNLWKSNGTLGGTVQVSNAFTPKYLTNVDGTLYFVSGIGSIHKTDPSSNTASSVVASPEPTYNLMNVNGTLFYTHNNVNGGVELYKVGPAPPVAGSLQLTAPTYVCATGQSTFNTSGGDGSPIEYRAIGITGWTTNPNQFVDAELRTAADAKPIVLHARQNGVEVTYSFDIRAQCPVGPGQPPPGGNPGAFAITGVTLVNCDVVTAARRLLHFTPQYAGQNGQPISFSVVNELLPTTNPGPYMINLYTDNPTITLKAVQTGTTGEASFNYNWLAACNGGNARVGVDHSVESELSVRLLGNPVENGAVSVEVWGGAGQPLQMILTDLRGQPVSSHQVERAGSRERHTFGLGHQSAGVYLLRVSTPTQTKTLKVLRK